MLEISHILSSMETGVFTVLDKTTGKAISANCQLSKRQQKILLSGGLLNYTKEGGQ